MTNFSELPVGARCAVIDPMLANVKIGTIIARRLDPVIEGTKVDTRSVQGDNGKVRTVHPVKTQAFKVD